ncbi:MAG: hypothetical protein NVV74_12655 [Magnetospirillum sp.]|nr:hypothetical protein [Magnetospirillum sp.]
MSAASHSSFPPVPAGRSIFAHVLGGDAGRFGRPYLSPIIDLLTPGWLAMPPAGGTMRSRQKKGPCR